MAPTENPFQKEANDSYTICPPKRPLTETAVSRTIDKIESALLRKSEALGVFLDIKGGFDNLDYEATLRAMREKGIPENITKWYGNLLAGRHALVTLDGKTII